MYQHHCLKWRNWIPGEMCIFFSSLFHKASDCISSVLKNVCFTKLYLKREKGYFQCSLLKNVCFTKLYFTQKEKKVLTDMKTTGHCCYTSWSFKTSKRKEYFVHLLSKWPGWSGNSKVTHGPERHGVKQTQRGKYVRSPLLMRTPTATQKETRTAVSQKTPEPRYQRSIRDESPPQHES